MQYKYNVKKENYSLFSSGNVLYSISGQPAFPVRLSSEIYQRCAEILNGKNIKPPYSIYDPFCGSGYLITTLGFLHGNTISNLTASDISNTAVELARRNLNLLTDKGLNSREEELVKLFTTFQKESHLEAIEKIKRLRTEFATLQTEKIVKKVFQADALSKESIEKNVSLASIDIAISDIPYGQQTNWLLEDNSLNDPVIGFLETIRHFVKSEGLIVLTTQSRIKFTENPNFKKVHSFKVGHRHIYLIRNI
ncbi:MAG: hypothetical protein LUM44_01390 [Pyrinomonadaceae bacterium]|nr:hypothetical protein [Pyrinomonadaceae bacterium]